ncbi:dihydrofolate reductase family protein [Spirillospora sp. NPDC047279]|uniref:dihydrofolate reductase family protein n=1 Tax=Spirillospora sp. NPDC047279 TaxID=3155478 RepID=UPI00340AE155
MGRVVYSMMASLDGYIEDSKGSIEFSAPDEAVHKMANEQTRASSGLLFGRRMYEAMEGPWREFAERDDLPETVAEFARLYLATPRIVFSDTLEDVPEGVRVVRSADAVAEITRLKEGEGELGLGGASLAASVIDLIDEFRVFVMPVMVGGGKPCFPPGAEIGLRLAEHRAFESGVVLLRYVRAD